MDGTGLDLMNSLLLPDGRTCSQRLYDEASSRKSSQAERQALKKMLSTTTGIDFEPPPSAQPLQDGKANESSATYPLQSIDEWMLENPYVPRGPKRKLVPIQVDRVTTESISQFHERCQAHGLQPTFTLDEVSKGNFTAKVVFGSETEEIDEHFPSKQAAKVAVCKKALARLPPPESKAGKKRKAEYTDVTVPQLDMSENWVGILMEYTQREKIPTPDFKSLQTEDTPIQFACTLSIQGGPPRLFGSDGSSDLFPTKQGAKATAAKEAVLWLRENGKLPPAGTKGQKVFDPESLAPGQTGLTQMLSGFGVEQTASLPQRMNEMIQALRLHTPSYDLKPSTTASGDIAGSALFDIAALFDERDIAQEPRLAGRVGESKRVLGQKKAKEACSQQVLELLERIQRDRQLQ